MAWILRHKIFHHFLLLLTLQHEPDEYVFTIDIKSPWELYFDGASLIETDPDGAQRRDAAGLLFKIPQGETIYHSFSLLKEECSNNEAEYEALIFGLLLALSMDIQKLLTYDDSQLKCIYEQC
jgi:ribonuclease HI